jgi:hypothetical protein
MLRQRVRAHPRGLLQDPRGTVPYIARAPVSLKKLVVEDPEATVLYYTAYNPYFRTNAKLFSATDFIDELLQHLPDCRSRLIHRYGLYSSRSRAPWLRKPHLVRLAPEGCKQEHLGPSRCARSCVISSRPKKRPRAWIPSPFSEPSPQCRPGIGPSLPVAL